MFNDTADEDLMVMYQKGEVRAFEVLLSRHRKPSLLVPIPRLYYQPYRDPAPGRWTTAFSFDYASVIEYNRLSQADYVLDSELLRMSLGLTRDLGPRTFVSLTGAVGGVARRIDALRVLELPLTAQRLVVRRERSGGKRERQDRRDDGCTGHGGRSSAALPADASIRRNASAPDRVGALSC